MEINILEPLFRSTVPHLAKCLWASAVQTKDAALGEWCGVPFGSAGLSKRTRGGGTPKVPRRPGIIELGTWARGNTVELGWRKTGRRRESSNRESWGKHNRTA